MQIQMQRASTARLPLHLASRNGWEKLASLLLEKGADVDVKSLRGLAPLHIVADGFYHIILSQLLKDAGAAFRAMEHNSGSPPHYLARHPPSISNGVELAPSRLGPILLNFACTLKEMVANG